MTKFPDFYIVGAAKAGTTSVWNYLRGHPDIHLGPIKEPNFFAYGPEGPNVTGPASPDVLRERLHVDTVLEERSYSALFEGARDDQVCGEASVRYLYKSTSAERIATARPDARIIMMLRDPVERLRSHYAMNRSWGFEPLELVDALDAEDERVASGWGWDWHYVRVGMYAEQLERYLRVFPREQILVLSYGDFRVDPVAVVQSICAHVGVDATFVPHTEVRSKEAYVPRSRAVDALRREGGALRSVGELLPSGMQRRAGAWLRRVNHQAVAPIDALATHNALARLADDRERLAELLGTSQPWSPTTH